MMERFHYDNKIVNAFLMATIVFGIVGMLVGLTVAFQLVLPSWNIHEWLSFGRLRPLHTNAVIFAFVGNMMFAGVYYSTQRLCKARMASCSTSVPSVASSSMAWRAFLTLGRVTGSSR